MKLKLMRRRSVTKCVLIILMRAFMKFIPLSSPHQPIVLPRDRFLSNARLEFLTASTAAWRQVALRTGDASQEEVKVILNIPSRNLNIRFTNSLISMSRRGYRSGPCPFGASILEWI